MPERWNFKFSILLLSSLSLNILLAVLFFYFNVRERPPIPYIELKPAEEQQRPLAVEHSDSEVIRYFRQMPLEWLVSRLGNTRLVENGYTQRDLALASLVAFYHFDLDQALAGLPAPQKRTIVYGKFRDGQPAEITVFPGLSEKAFEAVRSFAATERWPLTSKGLFLALQKEDPGCRDPSLSDAFFMTPEFATVETLLSRSDVPVDKKEVLEVIVEGNWAMLSQFVQQQKRSQDLSAACRQSFLLNYIRRGSKAAARLMLRIDGAFVQRKLDDNHVVLLLQLLEEKSEEGEQFALALLTSPRTDAVRRAAAMRLYAYAGEAMPEIYHHHTALSRFVPGHSVISTPVDTSMPQALTVNKTVPSLPQGKERAYIVQEGDSLWKIARRFNVDLEVLRAYNHLDSDILRPGRTLRIP